MSSCKDSSMVVAPSCNNPESRSLSFLQEPTATSQKPRRCRTEEEKSERNAAKHPLSPLCKMDAINAKQGYRAMIEVL